MSQQEALDHLGEAVVARYHEYDEVVAKIPSWGDEVDAIVRRYIEISRITVMSNLHWRYVKLLTLCSCVLTWVCGSFQSKRYFGSQNEMVRKTRRVPAIPFAI